MQNYWEQFPTIQVELQRVHDLMLQETMDAEPFISQPF